MTYDAYLIARMAHELTPLLVRARLQKIQQIDVHTLLFSIYHPDTGERALIVSADPAHPRIYLKPRGFQETVGESPSGRLLRFRKWLQGGRIVALASEPGERILTFTIVHKNEFHDLQTRKLIVELMGRHTNAILVDASGIILESLRTVTQEMTRYREIVPSRPYTPPPPQQKMLAHTLTEETWQALGEKPGLAELIREQSDNCAPHDPTIDREAEGSTQKDVHAEADLQVAREAYATWIKQHFSGIGTPLAAEIAYRTSLKKDPPFTTLKQTLSAVLQGKEKAQIVQSGDKITFAALELTHLDGDKLTFPTVHEALLYFYEHIAEERLQQNRIRTLVQPVQARLKKLEEKITMFKHMEAERPLIDTYRSYGTALLAYAHAVLSGETEVMLDDPFGDGKTLTIPLDPDLSPVENANLYFKRAQKLSTSLQKAAEQLKAAEQEKAYLESIQAHLAYADAQALEEIKLELAQAGILKKGRLEIRDATKKKRSGAHKDKKYPNIERFRSYRGSLIYVGKNNLQNDYVSLRLGKKGDLWFHVKHHPGAHVLLRPEPGQRPDEKEIAEAATLAVYFSKARNSSQVPVDMTDVKNVYKPNGAPPGFVLYRGEQTLFVTVDEAIIEALLSRRLKGHEQ